VKLASDGKPLLCAELPNKERVNDKLFNRYVKNIQLIQCVHCTKLTCTQKEEKFFHWRLLSQLVKLVLKQDYYVKYLLSIYFVSHLQFFNAWVW